MPSAGRQISVAALFAVVAATARANTVYVDDGAPIGGDGTTWASAYRYLQDALADAGRRGEIRVAGGVYRPDQDEAGNVFLQDREATFQLASGVDLYGGYRGCPGGDCNSGDPHARDIVAYETILNGDLWGNDLPGFVNRGDNSYHVVTVSGRNVTPLLDGVTISGGNASWVYWPQWLGGGLYIDGGDPVLVNCTFMDNSAGYGGAIYSTDGAPVLRNCLFIGNQARYEGGAMRSYTSSPTLTNCMFIGNLAASGGGVFNGTSNPTLVNCTFSGNVADTGSALYDGGASASAVANCIFWENGLSPDAQIFGSPQTLTHSCVQGGYPGARNIDVDPRFVAHGYWDDRSTPDVLWDDFWVPGDYHLQADSPCINAGDNGAVPIDALTDFEGDDRIQDCGVDIGADETPHTGPDCNANGISDGCDVALGSSADCNANAVPDECERNEDCNSNGTQDICDIAGGASGDCNSNLVPDECEGPVVYVDDDAGGGANDGTSWADAHTDLQDALADVANCGSVFSEIHVAQGTYRPGVMRTSAFRLVNGVTLAGGYRGIDPNDPGDPDERDIALYESVLSGDLAGDDGPDFANNGENSLHVFYHPSGTNLDETAVLDGFTVTGGNADTDPDSYGGGMHNYRSSPTVTNCRFSGNSALYDGGGMYNYQSTLTVAHCTFSANSARYGGGVYNRYGAGDFRSCVFEGNSAESGGGMDTSSAAGLLVSDSVFQGNRASSGAGMSNSRTDVVVLYTIFTGNSAYGEYGAGGGMRHSYGPLMVANCTFRQNSAYGEGGGLECSTAGGALTIANCVFGGNSAGRSGGAINMGPHQSFSPVVTSCTLAGNRAWSGGGIYVEAGDGFSVSNSILWNNRSDDGTQIRVSSLASGAVTFSMIEGGYGGQGNMDADPLFVDAGYWDDGGTPGMPHDDIWVDGDYHLQVGSPCIDAGDDQAVPGDLRTDFDEDERIQNCRVDIGADEASHFRDCNSNGVGDACDIGAGTSADCNDSGIPDECDPDQDCNANGVQDICDIGAGTSEDCNGNLVADECEGPVIYVDDDAGGGANTGTSWSDAYTDLQDALGGAVACGDLFSEIRVAQGAYRPGGTRYSAFRLVNGVTVAGGYRGNDPKDPGDPDDRDTHAFPTILTGDLHGNDGPDRANIGENSYQVFLHPAELALNESAVLDGFTITGGNADGGYRRTSGGGMYNDSASPTVKNCVFTANFAENDGGGMWTDSGSPRVIGCTFLANEANRGGGVYNDDGDPRITNSVFSGNTANHGGGLHNRRGNPTVTNCTFSGNSASLGGGGYTYNAIPVFVNCTFGGNLATTYGSAIYNYGTGGARLRNCIVWGNTPPGRAQIYSRSTATPSVTYSCVGGGFTGTQNIDADPRFVTEGYWNDNGTPEDPADDFFVAGDYHLQADSPCINAGNSEEVPEYVTTDFEGDQRIQHCRVDMGVDETPYYRDCNGNGIGDRCDLDQGTSEDCNHDNVPDTCNTPDCNENQIPDECDIQTGSSADCNRNDVPDDCEPGGREDCNGNGAFDLCDLHAGTSEDCNGDAIPDECEGLAIYVDDDAVDGANDGSSWTNAYTDLQDALAAASICPAAFSEVRVAQGSYRPGTSRDASFRLINGVTVSGGYRGVDPSDPGDPDERNIEQHQTVLTGDLNGDDGPDFANYAENSYHVFYHTGYPRLDETAMLDGVIITGGNANGDSTHGRGGGMYNSSNSPTVKDCTFKANSATGAGGGMYNSQVGGLASVVGCTFSGNSAHDGGGINNSYETMVTIANCVFTGNTAELYGGGAVSVRSTPTFVNCLFSGNSAARGGGTASYWSSAPHVLNCTYNGNRATSKGGGAYELGGSATITNCIFWANESRYDAQLGGSGETVSYSCVQGGYPGEGNIDSDPLFAAYGHWDDNGTPDEPADDLWVTGDYHLQAGSFCVNAGDTQAVLGVATTDFEGEQRIRHCRVDMGADETAYYWDCNGNDTPDACDIDEETSVDCNFNLVPDECDPDLDCNANGVQDICDVAVGTSEDCNGNEIPDQCEGPIVYVDDNATEGRSIGTNWADAYTDLQAALADVLACYPVFTEIRVAQGTYRPGESRFSTFQLINGVTIAGGYRGVDPDDPGDPDDRDIERYETILSGDLNRGNGPDFARTAETSIHVVTGSGTDSSSILEGFTITGGNAHYEYPDNSGGGMFNLSGSPTVISCTFTGNWAWYGGGIYNEQGNPTFAGCAFTANSVLYDGGGMANVDSSPLLKGCSFSGNSAKWNGGGVNNHGSTPTLLNCTFLGNTAQYRGGGMSNWSYSSPAVVNCVFDGNSAGNGGAISNYMRSSPELVNCILNGNAATDNGGGMYISISCDPTITNSTFSVNSAGLDGGGLYHDYNGNSTLTNCILWGNTDFTGVDYLSAQIYLSASAGVVVSYSCVQDVVPGDGDLYPGVGNTDENPLFADALGPDGVPGTGDEKLLLSPGSSCIDAGDNTAVPGDVHDIDEDGDTLEPLPVDQQGLPRLHDDPCMTDTGNPDPELPGAGIVDMGALEHHGEDTGDPDEDGITGCADNCPQHHNPDQADCDADGSGDLCRLVLGLSADCNDNGVPDECDVAGGGSDDNDDDGIPDECSMIYFVDDDAPANGDGASWQTAYRYLQDALAEAGRGDEIHVAGGTYKPDQDQSGNVTPGDRDVTFLLLSGVRLYGGYAGLADPAHPDIRDVQQYESILSGDLNGDDEPHFADDSRHVVTCIRTDENGVMDGFTVTAAGDGGMYNYHSSPIVNNCTFTGNSAYWGGGMYNDTSNPTVVDCTFTGNSAETGGGMYNFESSPEISGCVFSANGSMYHYAYGSGGGLYNGFDSDPVITDCIFSENWALTGGGMCNWASSPTLKRCTFTGNRSTDNYHTGGGGMWSGDEAGPTVIDCTFSGNSAEGDGGGIYDDGRDSLVVGCTFRGNWSMMGGGGIYHNAQGMTVASSSFTGNRALEGGGIYNAFSGNLLIVNCTLSGNSAEDGGGIFNYNNSPTVSNCILWGNSDRSGSGEHAQITNSRYSGGTIRAAFTCIQGLASLTGSGNIGHNPRFVDADGPDDVPGTEDDDVRLTPGSPCVDAADNRALPPDTFDLDDDGDTDEPLPLDLVGSLRFQDDPCVDDTGEPAPDFPTLGVADMGAYERPDDSGDDPDGDGLVNCDDNCPVHFNPTQEDCDEDGQGDACVLAYCGRELACRDCNGNGVPDACDIADGEAGDANGDGVPDQCQRVLLVDDDAPLGGDGASWPTAFKHLQDALAGAVAGDQIRVAQGTYTPDRDELGGVTPGDREATFRLLSGVALYGGYRGCPDGDCASGNPHQRDIVSNEAILSGDLLGDDPNPLENSYHVVTGSGTDKTAILDGFTITAGYADVYEFYSDGAGMYNYVGDPTVVNCTFTGNYAGHNGGGMFNYRSSSAVVNCTFVGNRVSYCGGAMQVSRDSTLTLNNCVFEENSADMGGALCSLSSDPAVVNCTFSGNTARLGGGGMYNEGSSPTVTHCTFTANVTEASHWADGGAMYNRYSSSPTVTECTFVSNAAIGGEYSTGGGISNQDHSSPTLAGCVFTRNSADYGGGVYNGDSSMSANCLFTGNSANKGGGVYNRGSSMSANCLFTGNSANLGGGMYEAGYGSTLANCVFSGNRAHDAGGAIHGWRTSASLANCTFVANSAPSGPALACDSTHPMYQSTFELDNCILRDGGNEIWNNDDSTITVAFSNVQDDEPGDGIVYPGTGNIDTDPMLLRPPDDGGDGWGDDPETPDIDEGLNDDYGNLRLTAGSPCIDSGDEAELPADAADLDQDGNTDEPIPVDLDGHARVLCGLLDMGAYEFGVGDLNCDQAVNLTDFAGWDACMTGPDSGPYNDGCEPFDFDRDQDVDLGDYVAFMAVFEP